MRGRTLHAAFETTDMIRDEAGALEAASGKGDGANGASQLFVEVFGEAGLHARFAVGANALPFNIPVEIESTWQVRA